jgi:phenylacetate-CoA ligase
MSQITGRRDDMLVIRGVNVYPSEVERVLLGHPSVSPDYLLVVDERGDAPELVVLCEYRTAVAEPAGQEELETRLRAELGVRVRVRVLPAGAVPRTEVGKAVRVVRWASGEPPIPGLG